MRIKGKIKRKDKNINVSLIHIKKTPGLYKPIDQDLDGFLYSFGKSCVLFIEETGVIESCDFDAWKDEEFYEIKDAEIDITILY